MDRSFRVAYFRFLSPSYEVSGTGYCQRKTRPDRSWFIGGNRESVSIGQASTFVNEEFQEDWWRRHQSPGFPHTLQEPIQLEMAQTEVRTCIGNSMKHKGFKVWSGLGPSLCQIKSSCSEETLSCSFGSWSFSTRKLILDFLPANLAHGP